MLRSELKLEFDGALASRAQEYSTALAKQEEATKALREELSKALDSNVKLSGANKNLGDEVAAATARETQAAQRETALREQLRPPRESSPRRRRRPRT